MAEPFGLNITQGSGTQIDPSRFARLSDIQREMRGQIPNPFSNASSMYSQRTTANLSTVNGPSVTPRTTRLFRVRNREQLRSHQSPNASTTDLRANGQPVPMSYSPAPLPAGWDDDELESPQIQHPHPAVLPDTRPVNFLRTRTAGTVTSQTGLTTTTTNDSGTTLPNPEAQARRERRRKRRRHRHHNQRGWTRSHRSGTPPASSNRRPFLHDQPKGDNTKLSIFISAVFLAATLATYIAIALSVKGLGQELHILFGITLGGGSIFLVHSLYRFHRNRRRRVRREARRQRKEKSAEQAGFTPDVPIRVHMVQDEEIGLGEDIEVVVEKSPVTKIPPPAYGIWRESVKVNPELLFWHRVQAPPQSAHPAHAAPPRQPPVANDGGRQGPRPPSYISDDGVSYVVAAQPRSTVYVENAGNRGHPAFHV